MLNQVTRISPERVHSTLSTMTMQQLKPSPTRMHHIWSAQGKLSWNFKRTKTQRFIFSCDPQKWHTGFFIPARWLRFQERIGQMWWSWLLTLNGLVYPNLGVPSQAPASNKCPPCIFYVRVSCQCWLKTLLFHVLTNFIVEYCEIWRITTYVLTSKKKKNMWESACKCLTVFF